MSKYSRYDRLIICAMLGITALFVIGGLLFWYVMRFVSLAP